MKIFTIKIELCNVCALFLQLRRRCALVSFLLRLLAPPDLLLPGYGRP